MVYKGQKYLSIGASDALKSSQKDQAALPFITRREKDVLLLVVEGYTNTEIAQKLFVSPTTIDTHRKSLLAKFHMKNTAALVRFVTQNNLI